MCQRGPALTSASIGQGGVVMLSMLATTAMSIVWNYWTNRGGATAAKRPEARTAAACR